MDCTEQDGPFTVRDSRSEKESLDETKILMKSVVLMFGKFAELNSRDAVAESLGRVNSVCLRWWTVLSGRGSDRKRNKRRLRCLLESKLTLLQSIPH